MFSINIYATNSQNIAKVFDFFSCDALKMQADTYKEAKSRGVEAFNAIRRKNDMQQHGVASFDRVLGRTLPPRSS